MNSPQTALLQHWLKDVITVPGTLQQKLQQAAAAHDLAYNDVIADTGQAAVLRRLNVYTSGYILRLLECLAADFPALQKFMGATVFATFAKASLIWSPPVSYTLYDLGKNFIAFLEATTPANGNDMMHLPAALARLERARHEALRAAGTEGRTDLLHDLNFEDMLWQTHTLSLFLPDSTRLLKPAFALKNFFEKLSADEQYELPPVQETCMAVARKNYRITIQELTEWQYVFLSNCTRPISLLQATELTATATGIPASTLMADLYLWLPVFCDSGLLACTRDQ